MIAAPTGNIREAACPLCGVTVSQQEQVALSCCPDPAPGPWWRTEPHRAPCGRWCMQGGLFHEQRQEVGGSMSRALEAAHGAMSAGVRSCQSCGVVEERRGP